MFNRRGFNHQTFNIVDLNTTFGHPLGLQLLGRGDVNVSVMSMPFRLTVSVVGTSDVDITGFGIKTPIFPEIISGEGETTNTAHFLIKQNINNFSIGGVGGLNGYLALKTPFSITHTKEQIGFNKQGFGKLSFNKSANVVFVGTPLIVGGQGKLSLDSTARYILLNLQVEVNGVSSVISSDVILNIPLSIPAIEGCGETTNTAHFLIKQNINNFSIGGVGDIVLNRLREAGTDIFILEGVNIPPGEWVEIDTDNMTVTYNGVTRNVEHVTTDSAFFQLEPVDNELTIETEPIDEDVETTVTWQNRWL